MPKVFGGLGLRLTKDINVTLVAKLTWKVLIEEDCLWVKILKAKYLKNLPLWQAKGGYNHS